MTRDESARSGGDDDPRDAEFDQLVADYLQAEEAGAAIDWQVWDERAGPRAAELRAFAAAHARMREVASHDPARETDPAEPGLPRTSSPLASQSELPTLAIDLARADFARPRDIVELDGSARSFGDYELQSEIARGGMGVVYRALHRKLNRVVALKMILAGEFATRDDVERFRKEATAAAQLDHPGIVHVFEVGECAGRQFFTMALIEGQSLSERIASGPLTPRQAAAVTFKLAEAIAYAHTKGIVHRDLKPANVLLARIDGPANNTVTSTLALAIGGEPKVTDFGLAKRVSDERGLTMTGQVVGTPSYMSPEQASGRSAEVGPASDIYSLGAILYELLTGRPPFRAATPLDTLVQVLESEPAPPRLVNPAVDRDLQTICLKCLEKTPELRYASAQDLADDLKRFLDDEPIVARSQHLLSRMSQALGRRRNEEVFEGWGRAITLLGLIVLVTHVLIFTLELYEFGPLISYWLPRVGMLVLLAANIAYHRPQSLLPTNAAERLIWALWIGFFLALGTGNLLIVSARLPFQLSYAVSAILGGLCFFVMGVHVWGGCFLIGAVFWLMTPVLALSSRYASLEYGVLWGSAMALLGAHYWSWRGAAKEES